MIKYVCPKCGVELKTAVELVEMPVHWHNNYKTQVRMVRQGETTSTSRAIAHSEAS